MEHKPSCIEYTAKIQAESKLWNDKWPNACPDCHGGGGTTVNYAGTHEDPPDCEFVACGTCIVTIEPKCPRCGHKDEGFIEGDIQCPKCYWNWGYAPGSDERQDIDPINLLNGCDCAYQGDEEIPF
jgi:hypothetical protein